MEVDYTGEDNPHAQESCRETEVSKLVKGKVPPPASPVLWDVEWEAGPSLSYGRETEMGLGAL